MNKDITISNKPAVNVAIPERVASGILGSYIFYKAITEKGLRLGSLALGGYLLYRSITGHCPGYSYLGKKKLADPVKNINLHTTLFIDKPRTDVYAFWRNLSNLPLFMDHLAKVEQLNDSVSRWTAKIPGGLGTLDWEAEIVKEDPDKLLGWRSVEGATVENAGKIMFLDTADGGTEVRIVISYRAPFGAAGAGLSHLLNPVFAEMVEDDVYNFKHYIEGKLPETEVLE